MLGCLRELDADCATAAPSWWCATASPRRRSPRWPARWAPTTSTSPPTRRRGRAGATRQVIDALAGRRRARPRLARRLRGGRPVQCAHRPGQALHGVHPLPPRVGGRAHGATRVHHPAHAGDAVGREDRAHALAGRPGRGGRARAGLRARREGRAQGHVRVPARARGPLQGAARQRGPRHVATVAVPALGLPLAAGAGGEGVRARAARAPPRSSASWPGATSTPPR